MLPLLPDDGGSFVDYSNSFQLVFLELLRRVYDKLHLEGRILFSHSITTFDSEFLPEEEVSLQGFGFAAEYDTRDNQFLPIKGMNTI